MVRSPVAMSSAPNNSVLDAPNRTPCNAVCPCDAMLQDAAILQASLEILNCLEPGDTVSDGSRICSKMADMEMLHDLRVDVVLGLGRGGRVSATWRSGRVEENEDQGPISLTSISSRLSCCPMHRSTFFLLLSCISPASSSSSRMK